MSNFKKPYKKAFFLIVSIVLTLGLSISLQSLLAAWTAPGASPPGSNVFPPVYNEHATPGTNALINMPLGVSGNLTLSGTGNIALGTNWLTGDGTDGEGIYIDSSGNVGVNDTIPDGRFEVNPDGTEDNGDEFVIDASGNVGVGVNPNTKLDVNGAIRTGRYTTAGRPTCNANTIGSFIFDTDEDRPYVCASGGIWKPLDSDYDKDGLVNWKDPNDTVVNNDCTADNGGQCYLSQASKSALDSDLAASNIKSGVNIFGVTGTMSAGSGVRCRSYYSASSKWNYSNYCIVGTDCHAWATGAFEIAPQTYLGANVETYSGNKRVYCYGNVILGPSTAAVCECESY